LTIVLQGYDTLETLMGVWGAGLYSSDMAADLRASVKSVLRLPLDEDGIVDILCDGERQAANDLNNEDHTTFWLVLADQFEKRGVAHAPTREKAIAIIARGDDHRDDGKARHEGRRSAQARREARRTRCAACGGAARVKTPRDDQDARALRS
jgi:hypothetical protein